MPDERIDRSLSRRPDRRARSAVSIYTAPGRIPLDEWDALVERTPGTDVTQLSAWARVRSSAGFDSLYVHAHRDGKLVGGAQLLHRRLPAVVGSGTCPTVRWWTTRLATALRSGPRSPTHFERWGHVGCG